MPERLEDVAIIIDGRRWRAWESVEIKTSLDAFASVSFEAPFEHARSTFRSTFQPFSFKPVELRIGDKLVFTGNIVPIDPELDPEKKTVLVGAYSKPAVLGDVTMPASAFPLELNGLTIRQIAERLMEPFGIAVDVPGEEGAVFRRVALNVTDRVQQFLTTLAQQRGLLLSDTPDGALRIFKPSTFGRPVVSLREGVTPLESVKATFSPQEYFTEITGIAKTRAGRLGAHFTVQNPFASTPLRPLVYELEDTEDPDLPTAVRAKLGRMFGNALAVTIEVPTWRDPQGELWEPDTIVELEAPSAMIYRPTNFQVRNVTLKQEANSISATLELALPGVFSGEVPASLPWEAAQVEILRAPTGDGAAPVNQKQGF